MLKVNNNYNSSTPPVSCSPDSGWELILLGHLLAKSLTLWLPSPTGSSRKVLLGLFLPATSWENSSFMVFRKHQGLVTVPPQLPRGISAPQKGVLATPWDASTAPVLPAPACLVKSHLFWNDDLAVDHPPTSPSVTPGKDLGLWGSDLHSKQSYALLLSGSVAPSCPATPFSDTVCSSEKAKNRYFLSYRAKKNERLK